MGKFEYIGQMTLGVEELPLKNWKQGKRGRSRGQKSVKQRDV